MITDRETAVASFAKTTDMMSRAMVTVVAFLLVPILAVTDTTFGVNYDQVPARLRVSVSTDLSNLSASRVERALKIMISA